VETRRLSLYLQPTSARMPYTIVYRLRASVEKTETVIMPTAREAVRAVEEIDGRNEIIDTITAPDGRSIRMSQLIIRADREDGL
jgi:hypothetical protein